MQKGDILHENPEIRNFLPTMFARQINTVIDGPFLYCHTKNQPLAFHCCGTLSLRVKWMLMCIPSIVTICSPFS